MAISIDPAELEEEAQTDHSPILRHTAGAAARRVLGTIRAGDPTVASVALTFDDGPDPQTTRPLLEVLAAHGARATFFMVGRMAAARPDLVRAVADAGHTVANHSWDHRSLPYLSPKQQRRQLQACQEALGPWGTKLFRPPYCDQSLQSRLTAARLGYTVVTYNVAPIDWEPNDASTLCERLTTEITRGAIVLLHDFLQTYEDERARDRAPMLTAVDQALGALRDQYRFVTVPELLVSGTPERVNWYQRAPVEYLAGLQHAADAPADAPADASSLDRSR